MATRFEAPRGTHDILPSEQPAWSLVKREFERLCGLYGYRRIDTPVFEDTDLFARTGLFSLISASFAAFLPAAANWHRSGVPAPVENAIRAIARWSYALYLCQLAVMRVMNATFAGNAQTVAGCLVQAILFIALSIASAALVYRFYEAPILRLRDRWTRESKSRADSTPEPLSELT